MASYVSPFLLSGAPFLFRTSNLWMSWMRERFASTKTFDFTPFSRHFPRTRFLAVLTFQRSTGLPISSVIIYSNTALNLDSFIITCCEVNPPENPLKAASRWNRSIFVNSGFKRRTSINLKVFSLYVTQSFISTKPAECITFPSVIAHPIVDVEVYVG